MKSLPIAGLVGGAWRGTKFCAAATLILGAVFFGRDLATYLRGVKTSCSVTGDLIRNLPVGEYATREIAFRLKNTAKNELATVERDTLYHLKIGFDMSGVAVEKMPDRSIRIILPSVKLLSMEEVRGAAKTVQKSLFARLVDLDDPDFAVEPEYQELLRQCEEQRLFDPALAAESLENVYKPILQEAAGPDSPVSFVLPAARPAAVVFREFFESRAALDGEAAR